MNQQDGDGPRFVGVGQDVERERRQHDLARYDVAEIFEALDTKRLEGEDGERWTLFAAGTALALLRRGAGGEIDLAEVIETWEATGADYRELHDWLAWMGPLPLFIRNGAGTALRLTPPGIIAAQELRQMTRRA